MKKVSIVTNFKTPEKASTARAAAEIFISCGAEVFMPVYAKESDEIAALHAGAQLRFVPNRELYEGPDILAVVGVLAAHSDEIMFTNARTVYAMGGYEYTPSSAQRTAQKNSYKPAYYRISARSSFSSLRIKISRFRRKRA